MRARSGASLALVASAAALGLSGCLGGDRQDEEAAADRRRAALAPAIATDAAPAALARGGEPASDLDAKLASGASLDVVREAAVRRNPDVQVALERWVAALEKEPQRSALPEPSLRYGYSTMFRMASYDVMQDVPFPTKLAAEGRAALAEARARREELREKENLLREQADGACAGLYLARRELAIHLEMIELLDRFVEIARSKYQAGTGSQPDVLRGEVERQGLHVDHARLAREVDVATSALNALLDRPPRAPVGPIAALPVPPTASAAPPAFEQALDARPDLAAALERATAADAMLSRAEQDWLPDFTVGGGYVRDFGNRRDEAELAAGITIPLWWGRIRGAIAEAEADARRARAEVRAARSRVLDEVETASARAAASAEVYWALVERALPPAQENVRASEAAYAAGSIDFLALIDAQRALLTRRMEIERALAEWTMRRAALERALGGR